MACPQRHSSNGGSPARATLPNLSSLERGSITVGRTSNSGSMKDLHFVAQLKPSQQWGEAMSREPQQKADVLLVNRSSAHSSTNNCLVGANPLVLGGTVLVTAGIKPPTPLKAIRARCMDCCGGSRSEVRKCVALDCTSWPFRMAKNPFAMRNRCDGAP